MSVQIVAGRLVVTRGQLARDFGKAKNTVAKRLAPLEPVCFTGNNPLYALGAAAQSLARNAYLINPR